MAKTPPAPGSGVTTNKKIEVFFTLERETKGALRYQEEGVAPGKEANVGTLYIRKAAGVAAPRIKVTIEAS
jgi:hypothetical protein